MDAEGYAALTQALHDRLAGDARVLGLVALGSMAQRDYQPDRWSDHDFFVVTQPGEQAGMRADLSWLPEASRIALAYQETAHGLKVIYENGHLLEFAVFDPDELTVVKVNRYRVLFDRADIAERLAAAASFTERSGETQAADDMRELGTFLANLLVGVGRHRRGEMMSGRQFVAGYALGHLLTLLARHVPAPEHSLLDTLDPTRRFERVYPALGAEINAALRLDTDAAARALLELALRELQPRIAEFPTAAAELMLAQL
jgi:hypothetical protein